MSTIQRRALLDREFSGIIALMPVLLLRIKRVVLWEEIRRN
jgi:hypothetical protein